MVRQSHHERLEKIDAFQLSNNVNVGYAFQIREALSRDGENNCDRIVSLLAKEVKDFENNPMRWMEPLVVALAEEMWLESAISRITEKHKIINYFLAKVCKLSCPGSKLTLLLTVVSAV